MNGDKMLPATPEGGGEEGAWLRIEYAAVRAIADYPDDLIPIMTAFIRWYCGLPYAELKGSKRAIFDVLRNSQMRNVSGWKKMSDGGRMGGLKSGESRRNGQGGFKGASTPLQAVTKDLRSTETEHIPNPTSTQPEPKQQTHRNNQTPAYSESVRNVIMGSATDVLKNVTPPESSERPQRIQSTDMYERLNADLVDTTLEIIGKPNDVTERKAWNGIYGNLMAKGHERLDIAEAVYRWHDGIVKGVDNPPRNRAAALNAFLGKTFQHVQAYR